MTTESLSHQMTALTVAQTIEPTTSQGKNPASSKDLTLLVAKILTAIESIPLQLPTVINSLIAEYAADASTITIQVRNYAAWRHPSYSLEIPSAATIGDLKRYISQIDAIPMEKLHPRANGRLLADTVNLADLKPDYSVAFTSRQGCGCPKSSLS